MSLLTVLYLTLISIEKDMLLQIGLPLCDIMISGTYAPLPAFSLACEYFPAKLLSLQREKW